MIVKGLMTVQINEELVQKWLQHVRLFDTLHPGCHFEMVMDAPDMSLAEMIEALKINPELGMVQIVMDAQKKTE